VLREADHLVDVHERERQNEPADEREHDVHGALVVERASGKIGAQHYATRSLRRMPIDGASASSNSGATLIRSRSDAAERKSSVSMRVPSRSSMLRRSHSACSGPRSEAPVTITREKPPPPSRSS